MASIQQLVTVAVTAARTKTKQSALKDPRVQEALIPLKEENPSNENFANFVSTLNEVCNIKRAMNGVQTHRKIRNSDVEPTEFGKSVMKANNLQTDAQLFAYLEEQEKAGNIETVSHDGSVTVYIVGTRPVPTQQAAAPKRDLLALAATLFG